MSYELVRVSGEIIYQAEIYSLARNYFYNPSKYPRCERIAASSSHLSGLRGQVRRAFAGPVPLILVQAVQR